MYVYFIAVTDAYPNMVKIGKAKNPGQRLIDMQTGCPYRLIEVGRIKCDSEKHAYGIESNAHIAFRDFNYRGEWFYYNGRLKRTIKSILSDETFRGSTGEFHDHMHKNKKSAPRPVVLEINRGDYLNDQLDREFSRIIG